MVSNGVTVSSTEADIKLATNECLERGFVQKQKMIKGSETASTKNLQADLNGGLQEKNIIPVVGKRYKTEAGETPSKVDTDFPNEKSKLHCIARSPNTDAIGG